MMYMQENVMKLKWIRVIVLCFCGAALILAGAYAADFGNAEELYAKNCASCHGMDRARYIGPGLNSSRLDQSKAGLEAIVSHGVKGSLMPGWKDRLSESDIANLAAFIKNTPAQDVYWDMADIRDSIEVYVDDEFSLPRKPTYEIDDLDDLIGVTARGRYANGENAKMVFFNGKNHEIVGEIPTGIAPHMIHYHPTIERWAYVKTDLGKLFKVDLYSMQAVRSVQVGFNGPSLAVSRDGRYVATGSFVPNTAVILDAETLEPVKFFHLKGIDPDGAMVEADSGSIVATHYGNYFAIALETAGQVWIVDLDKPNLPVTKIKNVGRHLHDAFLTTDGRYLIIAAYDDSKLAVIDFEDKKVVKDIPAGCVPHTGSGAITKVGSRMLGFGTNFGSGSDCPETVVTVFDADTFEVIKQIPTIGGTESPAAHPDAPYVAVDIISGDNASKIQFIDKETLEIAKTVTVGGHSHFPEYTADGKFLYVSAGYAGDKVVIYDSTTLEVVKEVSIEVPAGIFSHVRPKIVTIGLE